MCIVRAVMLTYSRGNKRNENNFVSHGLQLYHPRSSHAYAAQSLVLPEVADTSFLVVAWVGEGEG